MITISGVVAALLNSYESVLYTDVDEILVPDPAISPSLRDYCHAPRKDVTTAIGVNLLHAFDREAPLDPSVGWLLQRSLAMPVSSMFKPSLVRHVVDWTPGFHSYEGPVQFDGLYLFHVAYADLEIAMRRQEKRRRAIAKHPMKSHHHRASNESVRDWMSSWARLPEGTDQDLEEFARSVQASQQGRENKAYNIDTTLVANKLWSIPERFRAAF
jgi:hypothetical protein